MSKAELFPMIMLNCHGNKYLFGTYVLLFGVFNELIVYFTNYYFFPDDDILWVSEEAVSYRIRLQL